jgi:predicted metal-dependent phosphotriesterase family hydrolase
MRKGGKTVPSLPDKAQIVLGPVDSEHNIVLVMRQNGMAKNQIRTVLIDNARRILSFA